ncbi:ABC transporter substrate-binding protein [Desulfospira joergensenii]|uniref:ABC transporter substrate-binding protein n=1 Tax=Desulfospira joergensenii TaxID=53329 RepID=UPI0003B78492|nr:ABC transporter substrate-binding protein [Desulfospira joergensenii]
MKSFALFWRIFLSVVSGFLFMPPMAGGEAEPVKIGFVGDFTSVSKPYTENAFKIAQFALTEFNARGGLLGRPIQMIHRDGANDPALHYRHTADLVNEENVVAVFGGASSLCVLQASAACEELEIPYLVSIGNAQSIVVEKGHSYVFLFEPNSRMESLGFSIFASLMPWKRYAWLGPDYIWGRDVMGFFKQYFETIGSPITWAAEVWHPLGARDYKEAIQKVIASRPEALVVATWGEDLRHFLRQAKAVDLFKKTAAFGWFSIVADESDRILPEGIWKISRGPLDYLSKKYPGTRDLIQKFFKQYQIYPLDFSICCYDSLLAWHKAAEKAGSVEPSAVAGALKGLSFTGLRGDSFIRAVDGQMNCPTFFGRLTYVPDCPLAVIESVIEIPAAKTWLSEKEVIAKRAEYRSGKEDQ